VSRTTHLPVRRGGFVTDGGLETDLIFHHGVDLPEFAAFPLLEHAEGRRLLRGYYDGYAEVAAASGSGLLLESPTWRANPDWGAKLGYDAAALDRINADSMRFLAGIADDWRAQVPEIRLVGVLGPRGDGYLASETDPVEATEYHLPQVRALARGGASEVVAYTLTGVAEAVGVAVAARRVGIPATVSFTVETDGRLPDGMPLADAIGAVDAACAPAQFGINCAHPTHIAAALAAGGEWLERIAVVRANASRLSHAELDEAEELDDGNPEELADEIRRLEVLLPALKVLGGCCGTDVRHISAMWEVAA